MGGRGAAVLAAALGAPGGERTARAGAAAGQSHGAVQAVAAVSAHGSGALPGRLLFDGRDLHPENTPGDVRAQLFAQHRLDRGVSSCAFPRRALDRRAVLRGEPAPTGEVRRDVAPIAVPERGGKRCLAAEDVRGALQGRTFRSEV